ncbi:MAG: bifunctional (p)ppGpp synthetase/guanosine-3',5'-bis(diphosphate) 3'-pyrophosphohydrolase [Micavibrio aeruginosavorus]|uniref:Bifunctional (P)ppGpp synthetase/guanosine-3',5'-bis(Diphosphate) 3'-pyrophosphohydrolase n=1 Tax=Micavibrio aeruginosavorus TaxID=349221 RepID=A0A2W5C0A1_9BACT|nr:MAG: bifunctional (p)ppGpp synthetase/guanosine-3',5'-bis(diphosphate) 3'-pyrophosphohydrolase [Micavibrio aeruginosavorus]
MMIEKAKTLAAKKHAHLTLYNAAHSPAILHIGEVAGWVEQHGGSEDMIAAAWLHDIVEDTDVTITQVEEIFGPGIALLVDGLTDPPHFAPLPLEQRKPMQAERLKGKGEEVKLIKICDQLSNVRRILNDPPTDWNFQTQFQYIKGARAVADICRGVNADLDRLFDEAYEQAIQKYGDVE